MADRDLIEERHMLLEITQVLKVEIVAGIHSQTGLSCRTRRFNIRCHSGFGIAGICVGIRLGVKFHTVGACLGRHAYVVAVCTYENRTADTSLAQGIDYSCEKLHMRLHLPSGRRGKIAGGIGHQCHLLGFHLKHQVHELGSGIALDVELRFHQGAEGEHIVAADMPLVGARMHRNAVGTETLAVHGHTAHVRDILSPGISQGSDLIYIDAQISSHVFLQKRKIFNNLFFVIKK